MHMIRKGQLCARGKLRQRSSSMRWLDKPIRHPGPSSPTEKICDRTPSIDQASLVRCWGSNVFENASITIAGIELVASDQGKASSR